MVRSAALPGGDLHTYRSLEARVAAAEPRWSIVLIPPPTALPEVSFDGEAPDAAGQEAIATAIWAAKRLSLPIGVESGRSVHSRSVIEALAKAGVQARQTGEEGGRNARLIWLAPGAQETGPR